MLIKLSCSYLFSTSAAPDEQQQQQQQQQQQPPPSLLLTRFPNVLLLAPNPNPDKPEKFILYISPLCYSKEKGGFPLCYLRINTLIKFTASLPVMTA